MMQINRAKTEMLLIHFSPFVLLLLFLLLLLVLLLL